MTKQAAEHRLPLSDEAVELLCVHPGDSAR